MLRFILFVIASGTFLNIDSPCNVKYNNGNNYFPNIASFKSHELCLKMSKGAMIGMDKYRYNWLDKTNCISANDKIPHSSCGEVMRPSLILYKDIEELKQS